MPRKKNPEMMYRICTLCPAYANALLTSLLLPPVLKAEHIRIQKSETF